MTVAPLVWERLGDVYSYVEPFLGSGAVMLARPHEPRIETVNDASCFVANFWRALKNDPDGVAQWADYPVIHADLTARHRWMVNNTEFKERMFADPDHFDSKVAGWWVWGISAWIGSGWCTGAFEVGNLIPYLKSAQGVARVKDQRPLLRPRQGINALDVPNSIPHLWFGNKQGINRAELMPADGQGGRANLYDYMNALAERLRRVRVVNGDWSQVVGPSVTYLTGLAGIFLDPPYSSDAGRVNALYAVESKTVAHDVRRWCLDVVEDKSGRYAGPRYLHPKMRICLAGYEGEGHEELEGLGWEVVAWKANGGYSNQSKKGNSNRHKERLWFSPHCLKPQTVNQIKLF